MADSSANKAKGMITRATAALARTSKAVTPMAVVITDVGEEETFGDPGVMTRSALKRAEEERRRRAASGAGQGGAPGAESTPHTAEFPDQLVLGARVAATTRHPDGSLGFVQDQANMQGTEQPFAGSRQTGPQTVSTSETGALDMGTTSTVSDVHPSTAGTSLTLSETIVPMTVNQPSLPTSSMFGILSQQERGSESTIGANDEWFTVGGAAHYAGVARTDLDMDQLGESYVGGNEPSIARLMTGAEGMYPPATFSHDEEDLDFFDRGLDPTSGHFSTPEGVIQRFSKKRESLVAVLNDIQQALPVDRQFNEFILNHIFQVEVTNFQWIQFTLWVSLDHNVQIQGLEAIQPNIIRALDLVTELLRLDYGQTSMERTELERLKMEMDIIQVALQVLQMSSKMRIQQHLRYEDLRGISLDLLNLGLKVPGTRAKSDQTLEAWNQRARKAKNVDDKAVALEMLKHNIKRTIDFELEIDEL